MDWLQILKLVGFVLFLMPAGLWAHGIYGVGWRNWHLNVLPYLHALFLSLAWLGFGFPTQPAGFIWVLAYLVILFGLFHVLLLIGAYFRRREDRRLAEKIAEVRKSYD